MADWTDTKFKKLSEELLLGRADKYLSRLAGLIQQRARDDEAPTIHWRLTWGDMDITDQNLTLLELDRVDRLSGVNWRLVNPAVSATVAVAVLVACLMERKGMTVDEARESVKGKTAGDLLDAIETYQDDESPLVRPPQDGGTST